MYLRRPEVLWRRVGQHVVLLAQPHGDPISLTGSSAALWDVLARPVDVATAVGQISNGAEIEDAKRPDVRSEVVRTLGILGILGLVEELS